MHVFVYVYMYVCTYVCIYIHTQMYVCMSIHDSDLVIGMQIGIVQYLVAVSCCSVLLQCLVAVFYCSVLLQCLVAVSCCSVLLQCLVAVSCCSVLQYLVAVSCCSILLQCRVAVSCCCVLQCRVAVCRSALFVVGIQIGNVNAQSSDFLLQRLVAVSYCSVLQCLPHIGIVNAQSRVSFQMSHSKRDLCRAFRILIYIRMTISGRGWEQTNFVELWSVSRPRLAEMAIEIWVMCQLTEKLYETSSLWWNLQARICVQILGDTSISEHLRGENGKRPALSRKRSDILNIWQ